MEPDKREGREPSTDRHVGAQLRLMRKLRGYGLDRLSAETGVPRRLLEEYEAGTVGIPACNLRRIGQVLGVGPEAFFTGLDGGEACEPPMYTLEEALLLHRFRQADEAAKKSALRFLLLNAQDAEAA